MSRPHFNQNTRDYKSPYSSKYPTTTDMNTKAMNINLNVYSKLDDTKPNLKGLTITKDSQKWSSSIADKSKKQQIVRQQLLKNRSQFRQAQSMKNKQLLKQERQDFESKLKTIQRCLSQLVLQKDQLKFYTNQLSNQTINNLTILRKKMRQLKNDSQLLKKIRQFIQILCNGSKIFPLNQDYNTNKLIRLINDRFIIQQTIKGNHYQIGNRQKDLFTVDGLKIAKLIYNYYKMDQFMQVELLNVIKQKATFQKKFYSQRQAKKELQSMGIQKIHQMFIQDFQKTQSDYRYLNSKIQQIKNTNTELSKQITNLRSKIKPDSPQIGNKGTYSLQSDISQLKQSNQIKDTQIKQIKRGKAELEKEVCLLVQKNKQLQKNQNMRFKRTSQKSQQSRQVQSNVSSRIIVDLQQQVKRLDKQLSLIQQQNKTLKQQRQQIKFAAQQQQKQFKKDLAYMYKIQKEMEETRKQKDRLANTVSILQQQSKVLKQKYKQSQLEKIIQNQRMKVENHKNIIKDLTSKNQQLNSKYQLLSQQCKQVKQSFYKVEQQNKSLISINNELDSQNKALKTLKLKLDKKNKQIQQINTQVSANKKQISDLKQRLKEKETQKQTLNLKLSNSRKSQLSTNENGLTTQSTQIQKQKSTVNSLTSTISSKQKQLQQCHQKIRHLQARQKQAIVAFKGCESKLTNLQKQITAISTKYEKKIKQKDQQIQDLMQTNEYYQQMLEQVPGLKVNSSFSVDYKRSENANKNKQLEDQLNKLTQELKSSLIHQQQIQSELKDKQTIIKELKSQLGQGQRQRQQVDFNRVSNLQFQNNSLKAKISQIQQFQKLSQIKIDDYARVNALYQHQLLVNYYHHKLFLTETIENHYNLRIKRTKLIYRYDTLNKINFHQYIDNISNILLILKTVDGLFIAGYSEGPFLKKTSDKDGIIFSLTNRKIFTLVERNKRAITYDEYYLIFGNSQIRLKSLQNKIFSNFAISNGYYNSNGQKVSVLLGGGPHDRETELESYEIYQILFDDY